MNLSLRGTVQKYMMGVRPIVSILQKMKGRTMLLENIAYKRLLFIEYRVGWAIAGR